MSKRKGLLERMGGHMGCCEPGHFDPAAALSGMSVTSPVSTSLRTSSKGSHQKQLDLYSRCRKAVACTSGVNLWKAMCLRSESSSDRNRRGTHTGHTTKNTDATSVSSLYAAVPHLRFKSVRANSTAESGPSWKEMHDQERKMSEDTLGKKQKSRPNERGSADSTVEYNKEPGAMLIEAPVVIPEVVIDLSEAVRPNLEMLLNARETLPLEMVSRERRIDGLVGVLGTAKCPDPPEELATAGEEVGSISVTTPLRPRLLERALRYASVNSTMRNHAAIKPNGKSALRVSAVTFELVMHLEGTTKDTMSRFTQLK